MMRYLPLFLLSLGIFWSCSPTEDSIVYESESLRIEQISTHTFVHTSFLSTKSFGNVPCNGMIVIDGGEAVIFDTPTADSISEELIQWAESQNSRVKAIVPTHFHVDCLGGLEAFHKAGIPSYAHIRTHKFTREKEAIIPQIGFENPLILKVGTAQITCSFHGEGHTKDNIVVHFPEDKVLFGGCMIKSNGAGKGNLADANVGQWPLTVEKVSKLYPDIIHVIPGHGKPGGKELLNYTIALFSPPKTP